MNRLTTLILAFFAIYFVWGSTYLAIRIAIETMPPLIMLGFRFGIAGILMCAWFWLKGAKMPTLNQWRSASIAGGLMLLAGTGTVSISLKYVPSGMAALLITTVPLWMVMFNWLWKKGERPSPLFFTGFGLGVIGVALLVDPRTFMGTFQEGILAILAILGGSISWSIGSLYGRDADAPSNPFLSTAIQMTMGGFLLLLFGLLIGERMTFSLEMFSMRSVGAWLYLVVFGSFIAFSAYIWLMKNTSPSRVSTYAYVNPVIAVYLGWAFADEPITPQIVLASLLLITAVVIVVVFDKRPAKREEPVVKDENVSSTSFTMRRESSLPAVEKR